MRDDQESDWPDRLLAAIARAPLVREDQIDDVATLIGAHRWADQALTDRELDVLLCLSLGLGRTQTAAALSLSVATVKKHIAKAKRVLGAATSTEAVSTALRHGLID